MTTRHVLLSWEQIAPYSKEEGNTAEIIAREILKTRGNSPRLYQNTLVFLAVDKIKLQDLDDAVRKFLAWESILQEKDELNLDPHQQRQAENQRASAEGAVVARIPEAYQWLLVPLQDSPQKPVQWNAYRLSGQDPLAVRVSKKLRNDELMLTSFAPSRLRMELDRIPLWDGNDKSHISIPELVDYFARYLYLPRLQGPTLLVTAIQEGLKLLTWNQDSFAYADSYDEAANRYRGLVCGRVHTMGAGIPSGLVVRADVAFNQLKAESPATARELQGNDAIVATVAPDATGGQGLFGKQPEAPVSKKITRFHGSVSLDPTRVGRDASRIADEVLSHLAGIVGAEVKVTLEIEARIRDGVSDDVIRIVTQNCRDLKFESQGFEGEE